MRLSGRVPSSTPNPLSLLLDAKRRAGVPVCDLTVSNPTRAGIPYPNEDLLAALADPAALVYEPSPMGLPAARAAVARSMAVDPADVILCASTSEAYAFLWKLLCDPGDAVLAPAPSYPLFEHLTALEGVRLDSYPLAYDGVWHIDFHALEAAITPATRAILVVSPGNPTGAYLKPEELDRLQSLGLPLIVDEVFAPYPTGVAPTLDCAARGARSLVFSLGGLSKSCGLPQLKLAWIIAGGPRAEALARLEIIADAYLSVGAPVQHAAERLLAAGAQVRAAIAARVRAGRAALASRPIELLPSEGGWSAIVRVPHIRSDEEWALALLGEHDVLVHPGYLFDFPSGAHLVLSLLAKPDDLVRGAEAILRL